MICKVNDPIINLNTGELGEIIEVNNNFGWIRVRYHKSGHIRIYQNIDDNYSQTLSVDYARKLA